MRKDKEKKSFKGVIFLFVIGIFLILYPNIMNVWNEKRNEKLVTRYSENISKLSNSENDKIFKEAVSYNLNKDRPYSEVLNLGDGIMGSVTIPKINTQLIIYHGLSEEVLEKGAGHLKSSSLPVGGIGEHSVIAAHTGLPSAKLFTDLDQINKGDVFYFSILGRHLAYKVFDVRVVKPNEVNYIKKVKGKDLSTLVTCTPYGVNSHRLLVRGERIPYSEEKIVSEIKEIKDRKNKKFTFVGLASVGIMVVIILGLYRKSRK